MSYLDPTLTHDLASHTKPWALSPLVSTMPHFAHSHNSEPPKFPSDNALMDDNSELPLVFHDDEEDISSESPSPASSASSSTSSLSSSASSVHSMHSSYSKKSNGSTSMTSKIKSLSKVRRSPKLSRRGNGGGAPPVNLHTAAQRKNHFSVRENRKNVVFGPEDIITTDFCYGFLEFSPSLTLRLPGGISFDLLKYWDGQPVRFMCCERKKDGDISNDSDPWGRSFWCVAIEMVD